MPFSFKMVNTIKSIKIKIKLLLHFVNPITTVNPQNTVPNIFHGVDNEFSYGHKSVLRKPKRIQT